MLIDAKEKGEKAMLDNKEIFEAIKSMNLNDENMGQFQDMLSLDPRNLCRLPKVRVVVECGCECEVVCGILLYSGELQSMSREVLVLAIPYCKCCTVCYKICIISLDKVVSVCSNICC